MKHTADVIVIGAGMVGAATACMLARAGFSVQVIEQGESRPFNGSDPVGLRVSALSPGSQNVLTEAGAWKKIAEQRLCPYRRMKVEDGSENTVIEFSSAEFALERLGSIVENDLVQWSLWQQMQDLANVEVICPANVQHIHFAAGEARVALQDGQELSAGLLVGADGADSQVRKAMGIDQTCWDYGQQGIVSVVKSSIANTGLAWQRFMPGGPLAFLPLSDGSSSIVWSRPNDEARELLAMDDAGFLQSLQDAVQRSGEELPASSLFGELQSCGPRGSFPLTMALSETYTAHNAVLIGDAAHVVHPLAGQGVNLGFLDAAALVETLLRARKENCELGDVRHLQAFSRWRRSESELMARGIHGIRTLFSIEPLSVLRRLGLGLVSRSWNAKESFIRRAAGLNRNAPAVARGTPLGQLMR